MLDPQPSLIITGVFLGLTLVHVFSWISRERMKIPAVLTLMWIFFLALSVSDRFSFTWALWILALYAFIALREFFSLADIRIEDRWGIWLAYASIPAAFYMIQIHWYGLFIIAIPVYTFLAVPFLVALGKKSQGMVFSVGVIDFGLFFYVFCMGHIAYLMYFSERITALMIVMVVFSGWLINRFRGRPMILKYAVQVLPVWILFVFSARWTGIPLKHGLALGVLIPVMTCAGDFTLNLFEDDLGIHAERLQPGRGRMIDALKLVLFVAPVMFHYLRWFLNWGDLQ